MNLKNFILVRFTYCQTIYLHTKFGRSEWAIVRKNYDLLFQSKKVTLSFSLERAHLFLNDLNVRTTRLKKVYYRTKTDNF